MNIFLLHLASREMGRRSTGFNFPSFQNLFDTLIRSMVWRIGGRTINALPFAVIIGIVVIIGIIAIAKYVGGKRR